MRVLVFGAAGQLGAATASHWISSGHDVVALTRQEVDVTSLGAVADAVAAARPDLVINCTAYNRVDDAEEQPSAAFAVNTWAVKHMADALRGCDGVFVHYSTDFVFDGALGRPYVETDPPNPQSAYGTSKLMGEWFAADVPRHYVLRVESLFGGAAARSSLDSMLRNMRSGVPVTAFADRTVSPSYVADVARATWGLVTRAAPAGLYHCVNSGMATWLDVAHHLRAVTGLINADITGVPAAAVNLRARRPQFAAMSNAKLGSVGIPMPTWQDAVARHIASTQHPAPST
jgi:dTDP-4-dehydrorhamnose reductase